MNLKNLIEKFQERLTALKQEILRSSPQYEKTRVHQRKWNTAIETWRSQIKNEETVKQQELINSEETLAQKYPKLKSETLCEEKKCSKLNMQCWEESEEIFYKYEQRCKKCQK